MRKNIQMQRKTEIQRKTEEHEGRRVHTGAWGRAGIVIVGSLAVIILALVYASVLCRKYKPVKIGREAFYGEENQNLKDFIWEGDHLRSVSGDPWVECELKDAMDIRVIELNLKSVEKQGMRGEIFDQETWESEEFRVRNGKIFIFYGWDAGHGKKKLRFDLVEEAGVCLDIESVAINSRTGIVCDVVERFGFLLICYLVIAGMLFFYMETKRQKALTGIWLGMQMATAAAAFCIMIFTDRTQLEIKWLWILCLAQLCMSLAVLYEKNKTDGGYGLAFAEKACFIIVCVGMLEISSGISFNFQNLAEGVWNFVLVWLVVAVLSLFLRSYRLSVLITGAAAAILGTANHYFYLFRGAPLQMTDILLAETAVTVAGNYMYPVSSLLAFFFLTAGDLFFYCLLLDVKRDRSGRARQACMVGIFLVLLGIVAYTPEVSYWNMVQSTQTYGYLSAFTGYAKKDLLSQKPPGYSVQKVKEILDQYQEDKAAAEPVDVIVIMNEAFSDLPAVYDFETDVDGMPFIHALKKNTVKGDMLVSIFGGSTANTEYEFLTGNSMAFFRAGNVPYVQYVKSRQESLAGRLKEMGYQTAAFHPSAAENYHRDRVYPLLGFDEFFASKSELKYRGNLRGYMSDMADFKNIIDIYENRDSGKPFFLFNVTMQNHGGYSYEESSVEVTVTPVRKDLQCVQLMEYLSLVKKTDEAFEMLVNYFDRVDHKTVILMFGDHQPGLDSGIYDLIKGSGSEETAWQMYTVPFVLWGNFDLPYEDGQLTSPGYLRQILMETAGLPLDPYGQFLLSCREQYPAVNSFGYFETDGTWKQAEQMPDDGLLGQYRMLQYANTFDKKAKDYFGR